MRVREVMTRDPVTVSPDTPVKDIVRTMLEHQVSGVPVVDGDDRLCGIVTEADLMSREGFGPHKRRPLQLVADYFTGRDPAWLHRASGTVASEVMTPSVVTIGPNQDVREAARTMLIHRVKRLVVVENGAVVGVVSRQDALQLFAVADDEVVHEITELLADPWRVPEGCRVEFSVDHGIVRLDGSVARPSDLAVVEHAVDALPGVIGVESQLGAREAEPRAVG